MAILIFLVSLALRLPFLSPWLEDWDSVQFALAMDHFDLPLHQPHAPGYPLYILTARFINLFAHNQTLSLTLLSAIAGSLITMSIYLLTKKMFGQKEAILAAFIFALAPISWLMSVSALTNIPGLAALIFFVYLLYNQKLYTASFWGGLLLGFRATELPVIIFLLTLAHLRKLRSKTLLISIYLFVLGLCVWLIPLIIDTGPKEFINSYTWIANYVVHHDSLISQTMSLTQRVKRIGQLLAFGNTPFFTAVVGLALVITFTKIKNLKIFKYQFLLVWFLAYALPLLFFYNLEVTRYVLPLLPPSAIISAHALFLVSKKLRPTFFGLIAISIIAMSFQGFQQVSYFKKVTPPAITAVKWVQKKFSRGEVVLLTSFTCRQFQYYAPELTNFYNQNLRAADFQDKKFVIVDFAELVQKVPAKIQLKEIEKKSFINRPDIYTRLSKVDLTVYTIKSNE